MNRSFLVLFFLLFVCTAVRADFTQAYQNTGRPYSNPDYDKSSIWVNATNYPGVFLDNCPVEINSFRVTEFAIELVDANDVNVSFLYDWNGDHKLNIFGVDIVDASGTVIKKDYHYGTDGGGNTSPANNVYTLSGVPAGIYTMRCFACNVVGGDVVTYAAGTISVSGACKYIVDGVYELKNQGNAGSRGWFVFSNLYPGKIKVAASSLSGYTSSNFCFPEVYATALNCRWYLVTSNSGKRYLFSLQDGSFISKSGEFAILDSEKPLPVILHSSVRNAKYFHIKAYNGEAYLSNEVVNGISGEQACWVGDGNCDGAVFEFVKNLGQVNSAMLLKAKEIIEKAEQAPSFEWSSSTLWSVVDESDYSSVALNENRFDDIYSHDYESLLVDGASALSVTFNNTGTGHALNICGVELVDGNGCVVSGDYHAGIAGAQPMGNVYALKVVEAGEYSLRVLVTGDANNEPNESDGVIAVALEGLSASDFAFDVEFKEDFATLYLGYKVAVPPGVEAYVVNEIASGWVRLERLGDVIPATTPVILKNAGTGTVYTFVYTNETAPSVGVNMLKGSFVNRYVMGEAYVLAVGNSGLGFYLAVLQDGMFLNNANRAYLPVGNEWSVPQNGTRLRLDYGNTLSIETSKVNDSKLKAAFNLRGLPVGEFYERGIYIIDGKKVLFE